MEPHISVCIPMYNEAEICADTARTLHRAMESFREKYGWSYEVIFSDDGSRDGCADIVRKVAEDEHLAGVRVVGYGENRGKGAAVREAVLASKGEIVLYTDCDLAYGTDVIADAVSRYADGVDAVIGSRNLTEDGYAGYTFMRKLASKMYIKVLCLAAGFKLSDSQCGCKSFRGEMARKIFAKCETNGFAFDFEVLLLAGKIHANIAEMPVKIINHRESTVHVVRDSVKMLRDLAKIKKRVKKVEF
ncbi:MAG: glycosyltransferase [Clostridia bacterium]|nr:glycosyltransferase [Clostridia bacterium]